MATENPVKPNNLDSRSIRVDNQEAGEMLKHLSPEQQAVLKEALNRGDVNANHYSDSTPQAEQKLASTETAEAKSSNPDIPGTLDMSTPELINDVEILRVMHNANLISKENKSSKNARETLESLGIQ